MGRQCSGKPDDEGVANDGYVDVWNFSEFAFGLCSECNEVVSNAYLTGMPDWSEVCSNGCNWHPCGRVWGCDAAIMRPARRVTEPHFGKCDPWVAWFPEDDPNPCTEAM